MSKLANTDATKSRTKKEIEAISEKIKASRLKIQDIVIPLSVGLILLILGIFVFVPMIKSGLDFRSQYKEIRGKEDKLKKLEDKLKSVDEGTFQIDLLNAKEVIPRSLQVSSFMYYIDTLAREKNLVSKSLSAGDTQVSISTKSDTGKEKRSYLGVSGPLSYSGNISNVLSFLDTLYSASPYIISAENISLKKTAEEWRVTLNVTGYYVPEEISDVDIYAPLNMYTQHKNIMEIFAQKAERLK